MENSIQSMIEKISPFVEKGKWTIQIPIIEKDHTHLTIGCIVFDTKAASEIRHAAECLLELEQLMQKHPAAITTIIGINGVKVVMSGPNKDRPAIPVLIGGTLGPHLRAWHEWWLNKGIIVSDVPNDEIGEKGTIFLHVTVKSTVNETINILKSCVKITKAQVKPVGHNDPFLEILV